MSAPTEGPALRQRDLRAAETPPRPAVRVLALRSIDGRGGGADAVLLRTAAKVNPEQVRITVCGIYRNWGDTCEFARRAAQQGIDYCGVGQPSILARGVLPAIRRIVADRQITIVDAHDYKAAFFAARLARLEAILPVATLHGWSGHSARERLLYYPAEKWIVRSFPLVIAVSQEIADTARRWGANPERVKVLLNGVDPLEFRRRAGAAARARRLLAADPNEVLIGAVGRLEPEKRFDLLLETMAVLLRGRPELRLILVGEGSLGGKLQNHARRLGIGDRCRWLAHRRDLVDLYPAMDVLAQSSDHEGTPTVLVEAMAMEVPIVATAVGGTGELLEHGIHGLLVPRRNPAALAAAIEQTLSDRDATSRRVAAARKRVESELSLEARTRKLEQLYGKLAQERPCKDEPQVAQRSCLRFLPRLW